MFHGMVPQILKHSCHVIVNLEVNSLNLFDSAFPLIDDFRGACAVKGNVQVAGRTSSVSSLSTTEMLSTNDVTLRNVDGSLFHVQI